MSSDPAEFQHLDPRQVAEYGRFAALHPISPVPETPPRLLPGPTPDRMIFKLLLAFFAALGLLAFVFDALPTLVAIALICAVGLAVFWGMAKMGDKELAEVAAGYTTVHEQFGSPFFWNLQPRTSKLYGDNGMVSWDFSTVWRLDSKGRVKSPPLRSDGMRPGFYPSPHKANRLELWTGEEWGEAYRKDRSFFGTT